MSFVFLKSHEDVNLAPPAFKYWTCINNHNPVMNKKHFKTFQHGCFDFWHRFSPELWNSPPAHFAVVSSCRGAAAISRRDKNEEKNLKRNMSVLLFPRISLFQTLTPSWSSFRGHQNTCCTSSCSRVSDDISPVELRVPTIKCLKKLNSNVSFRNHDPGSEDNPQFVVNRLMEVLFSSCIPAQEEVLSARWWVMRQILSFFPQKSKF